MSTVPFPIKLRQHNLVAGCTPVVILGIRQLGSYLVAPQTRFLVVENGGEASHSGAKDKDCFSILKVSL